MWSIEQALILGFVTSIQVVLSIYWINKLVSTNPTVIVLDQEIVGVATLHLTERCSSQVGGVLEQALEIALIKSFAGV